MSNEQNFSQEVLERLTKDWAKSKEPEHGFFYSLFVVVLTCVLVAFMLCLVAAGAVLEGYTFVKCWEWFVLPVFTNMPVLTLLPAIGIALMVSLVCHQSGFAHHFLSTQAREDKKYGMIFGHLFSKLFFRPLIVLGMAYIVHYLMTHPTIYAYVNVFANNLVAV